MDLLSVTSPEALLTDEAKVLPYDFENFIQSDSFGARRRAKAKLKLLKIVHPAVLQVLREGEQVYFVTSGQRVSTFEQFFIGWASTHYNTSAFVFTSERVLLFHLKSKKARGTYLQSLEYPDLQRVKASFLGNFVLKFRNGKSVLFARVPRADRRYLRDFLNSILNTEATKDRSAIDIRHLCPGCFSELVTIPKACPSCATAFKSPRKAALLSLVMPGLGDLYLGAKVLGGLELAFMLYLWSGFLYGIGEELSAGTSDLVVAALSVMLLFVFIHPLDALKSHYLAKKGLLPLKPIRYAGE